MLFTKMKTPLQEFYEFMEQNQYFIGNDLYNKYNELLEKEKEVIADAFIDRIIRKTFNKDLNE